LQSVHYRSYITKQEFTNNKRAKQSTKQPFTNNKRAKAVYKNQLMIYYFWSLLPPLPLLFETQTTRKNTNFLLQRNQNMNKKVH
jgi:hypothetical protein